MVSSVESYPVDEDSDDEEEDDNVDCRCAMVPCNLSLYASVCFSGSRSFSSFSSLIDSSAVKFDSLTVLCSRSYAGVAATLLPPCFLVCKDAASPFTTLLPFSCFSDNSYFRLVVCSTWLDVSILEFDVSPFFN